MLSTLKHSNSDEQKSLTTLYQNDSFLTNTNNNSTSYLNHDSPTSMRTSLKDSSPTSSTEPTSMRSDKSVSRMTLDDKIDGFSTSLDINDIDKSISDASLSPTREFQLKKLENTSTPYSSVSSSNMNQQSNQYHQQSYCPPNHRLNDDHKDLFSPMHHSNKLEINSSAQNMNQNSFSCHMNSIPSSNINSNHFTKNYSNNTNSFRNQNYPSCYGPNNNYLSNCSEFSKEYQNPAKSMIISQNNAYYCNQVSPTKMVLNNTTKYTEKWTSNDTRKRPSQICNGKGTKKRKNDNNKVLNQEMETKIILDDPKRFLKSPNLQSIANVLPPNPCPKFINPITDSGLPTRLKPDQQLTDQIVNDSWGNKYYSSSLDIKLFDDRTFQQLFQDSCIINPADSILYDFLFDKRDKKNLHIKHPLQKNNILKRSKDKSIARMATLDPDYTLPPSPDDSNCVHMNYIKALDDLNMPTRCTTPLLDEAVHCDAPAHQDQSEDMKHDLIEQIPPSLVSENNLSTSQQQEANQKTTPFSQLQLNSTDQQELVCVNCNLQIIPRISAIYSNPTLGEKGGENHPYCSYHCMKSNSNSSTSSVNNNLGIMINSASKVQASFNQTSLDANNPLSSILSPSYHTFLKVPVIIQNFTPMGRIIKSGKRVGTEAVVNQIGQSKFRRKSGEEIAAISPHRKWAGTRWLRHTPNGPLYQLRNVSNKNKTDADNVSNLEENQKFKNCVIRKYEGDKRKCTLCGIVGDGDNDLHGRLLNYTSDTWIHLNCALWSYETYETVSGSLVDLPPSIEKALQSKCWHCAEFGAGLPCFYSNCKKIFHLHCAQQTNCSFYADRGMFCESHSTPEKSKSVLDSLSVARKVYIERDEDNLVDQILQHDESKRLRIGSLILESVGQLIPEQLSSGHFNDDKFIFPIGYSISRFFWSTNVINKRCLYQCRIEETHLECRLCERHAGNCKLSSQPKFVVNEFDENGNLTTTYEGLSTNQAWRPILKKIEELRLNAPGSPLKFFSKHMDPNSLFGFHEPHIIRALESLPGIEHLTGYQFKFGRTQLISEMPLAINPSGCARSEPKLRTYVKRRNGQLPIFNSSKSIASHTPTHSASVNYQLTFEMSPTSRSIFQSKTLQYKKLKSEWKSNVILSRSRIQGFGLFAARDLERSSFIIEYLGETIRNEVANRRERLYESQSRGIYMFRADEENIVDATMSGGLARYINHSCSPNCMAEVIMFDGESHIVIIANRKIDHGEELTYDYKFDLEEDKPDERIPCLCGARNCRKWMN